MAEHEVKRLSMMMMMLERQVVVQADFQRNPETAATIGEKSRGGAEDRCPAMSTERGGGGGPLSKPPASAGDTNKRDTYKRKREREIERERERERERGREERRTKKVGAFFYPADRVVNTYVIKLW